MHGISLTAYFNLNYSRTASISSVTQLSKNYVGNEKNEVKIKYVFYYYFPFIFKFVY